MRDTQLGSELSDFGGEFGKCRPQVDIERVLNR